MLEMEGGVLLCGHGSSTVFEDITPIDILDITPEPVCLEAREIQVTKYNGTYIPDTTIRPGDELPDVIRGTYKDDYNILTVHETILKRFKKKIPLELSEARLSLEIEKGRASQPQNGIDRFTTLQRIAELEDKIYVLSNELDRKDYEEQVGGIIQEYAKIGPLPIIISFGMKEEKEAREEETEEQKWRHYLIVEYLEIARKYITIDVSRTVPVFNECPICSSSLDDISPDELGILYCPKCGAERLAFNKIAITHDPEYETSNKSGYEDEDNFIKAFKRKAGLLPPRFVATTLFTQLDSYYASYNLPTSEVIRALPLNSDGTRGFTTRGMLREALQKTGNSAFYEDEDLIAHLYWGWLLPNIAHLEDTIRTDYRETQRVFRRYVTDRKSSLNTQYRLFKHLEARGYKCKITDFKVVTMREILEYHDSMWKIMVEEAGVDGLEFIATI